MKRIVLFLATNLAVVVVLGIVANLLGVNRYLTANGLNLGALLGFAFIMGFGGAIISLLLSKTIAKWSSGVQLISGAEGPDERWIVETVRRFADKAGIGMPEVGIFEGEPNAFATGAFKNSALVAVSTGLLQGMTREEVEAVIGHEVAHIANGDMVTMTLIQGVMNTFVVFLSRVMFCSRPVDTATSEEFLNAPVAKALGSPSKMPTSGMPMPALSANLRTVPTIQASSGDWGLSIMRMPVVHLAIGLLISSEMIAPPKPMISAKPSNAVRFSPLAVRKRLTPSRLATMPSTATTITLVKTNRRIRFKLNSPWGNAAA